MVTTDLLESEDRIAKSKMEFRSIQCTYNQKEKKESLCLFSSICFLQNNKQNHTL